MTTTATAHKPRFDRQEVMRACQRLFEPGQVFELRAMKATLGTSRFQQTVGGYFNNAQTLASQLVNVTSHEAVYVTLQLCRPDLLARTNNTIKQQQETTADRHILRYRWLMVDCDPDRPSGISSTDSEHSAAHDHAQMVRVALTQQGWPMPVYADSGNGAHLLYRVDLPVEDSDLVKRVLQALSHRFSTELVKIDEKVYNPARICKLYGSRACKGADTEQWPHRMSRILESPDTPLVVTREQLEQIATPVPVITAQPKTMTRPQPKTGDTPYGLAALEAERQALASAGDGGRNDQLNKSAYALGQLVAGGELTETSAEQALHDAALQSGLDEREIEKTLASGLTSGMQSPRSAPATPAGDRSRASTIATTQITDAGQQPSFNLTDLGNAERFAHHWGHTVRWCEVWNCWMIFNGKCWERDRAGKVDQFAKITVRRIYAEASAEPDDANRAKIAKHAGASESNRAIRAMLDRAKSELPVLPEQFNTHLHLLNVGNGTLNLKTGELQPHRPEDMLTRCLKVDYKPLASAPQWDSFVTSIFADDQALINFVQMSLGMSLSGDVNEQCWFLCHGAGSNGKTTLTETVRTILADYGLAANIESFQAHKGERVNNDVAEFYGARLITASENQVGSRLNEAFIKKITGNEPLRARRLHENEFQFMPECTIWLSVNHKPVVKDTSRGMWRRVHYIPFEVTFEDHQIDKDLPKKLLSEAEGILAWLVRGCVAWYDQGRLVAPDRVKAATQAYREEMDVIAQFIAERCTEAPGLSVKASTLYDGYKQYCLDNGESYEKSTGFGLRMSERGYQKERRRQGKTTGIFYLDLTLTPDESPVPPSDGTSESESVNSVNSCEQFSYVIENAKKYKAENSENVFTTIHTVHNPSQRSGESNPSEEDSQKATPVPEETTIETNRLASAFLKKYKGHPLPIIWAAPKTGITPNRQCSPREWYDLWKQCVLSGDQVVRDAAIEAIKIKLGEEP